MKKFSKICFAGIIGIFAYVLFGNILHRLVFPEPNPSAEVYPIVGDRIVNQFAGESYTVLKTKAETNGEYSEIELHLDPGGAIPKPHIHPHYEETFTVIRGTLKVIADGIPHILGPGESFTVPRGTAHQPFNNGKTEFVGIVKVNPPAKWDLFISQIHGFFTEKQEPRTDIEFFLQAMLVTAYYEDTYLASPPIPVQKILAFVIAPTARLLGHKSWKREISLKWRQQ